MGCKRCGNCCRVMIVKATEGMDIMRTRERFKKFVEFEGEVYAVYELACMFLDGEKCKVYGSRFEECKAFPEGKLKRMWKAVFPECGMV